MLALLPMLRGRFTDKTPCYTLINCTPAGAYDTPLLKYFFSLIWQNEKFIYI